MNIDSMTDLMTNTMADLNTEPLTDTNTDIVTDPINDTMIDPMTDPMIVPMTSESSTVSCDVFQELITTLYIGFLGLIFSRCNNKKDFNSCYFLFILHLGVDRAVILS